MTPSLAEPEISVSVVRVIESHRRIMTGMLAGAVSYAILFVVTEWWFWEFSYVWPLLVVVFAISFFLAVWVFRLVRELYGATVGVVCTILLCVPPVAALELIVLYFQATSRIRSAGHRVGLIGISGTRLRQLKHAVGPLWS